MATIDDLLNAAAEVRDEDQEQENTAFRVGTLLVNVIQCLSSLMDANADISDAITGFSDWAEGVAEKEPTTHLLKLIHSRIILLDSMGSTLDGLDYTPVAGDLVWRTGYVWKYNGSTYEGDGLPPKSHVVYVNKHTSKMYMWNGDSMAEVGNHYDDKIQISKMDQTAVSDIPVGKLHYIPSQSKLVYRISANKTHSWTPRADLIYIDISTDTLYRWQGASFQKASSDTKPVNDLTTGGGEKALSAEMGKRLKAKVDEVQANIQRLYNNLGNIAFWDAAAKSSAAPVPIDWGNPKHAVTLALSLTNAVVKHNGEVVSNGSTIQVEEGRKLTLTVEPADGYALASVTSSTTGATVTDLGNGTYSVAIVMGGSDLTLNVVAVTSAGDYEVPADGEMVFFLDGKDLTDGATTWVDKVGNVQFTGNGTVVKVDGVPVGMSFNGSNQKMSKDSVLNFSPITHTIEIVAKPVAMNSYKLNYLFTDGTQTTDNGGKNEAIHAILYKDGDTMYMNGVFVDGTGTQGQDGSWIDGHVWSMPFTLNSNICIGANKKCAVNNGSQMQSLGVTHWTTLGGQPALGAARTAQVQNVFLFSNTVVYAVRIYRGQLTAAQMLHNQKIDNERYGLGLTLPDNVS